MMKMKVLFVFINGFISFIAHRIELCVSLFYSIIFNFSYLPYCQAKYLPIWLVYPHFNLIRKMRDNKIIIETDKIKHKMICLGKWFNTWNTDKGIEFQLRENSTLVFHGDAVIGNGSTIVCYENAVIEFGKNFSAASGTTIIAKDKIKFGNDVMIGWNCLFTDTNFHHLTYAQTNETFPINEPIIIGNNNWLGFNCVVMKGFRTKDCVTISAGTICAHRTKTNEMTVYGNMNKLEVLSEGWYYNKQND